METSLKQRLSEIAKGRVIFDPLLRDYTTMRVGGPAWAFAEPDSIEDLKAILRFLRTHGVSYTVIGKGSNLLAADNGYRGVLICLERGFSYLDFHAEGDRVEVKAGAGTGLPFTLRRCGDLGYAGLEFLTGVPGTVGGAIRMNAGAFGGQTQDVADSIRAITGQGEEKVLKRSELRFSYRRLSLDQDTIIVEATLGLTVSTPEAVREKMNEYARKRKGNPKGKGVAGSIFRNPPGESAGRLIEMAGLKGSTSGAAEISREHANWIVNQGQATAGDVRKLMNLAQEAVREKFGVWLEPEVIMIGFENNGKHGS